MTHQHGGPPEPRGSRLRGFLTSPLGLAVCALIAAAGLHVLAALPFLVPAVLCLVMHLFMHGRHGGQQ